MRDVAALAAAAGCQAPGRGSRVAYALARRTVPVHGLGSALRRRAGCALTAPSQRRRLVLAALALAPLAALAGGAAWWFARVPLQARVRPAAADAATEARAAALRRHVARLSEAIGVRHAQVPGSLEAAAGYIAEQLAAAGLAVRRERFGDEQVFFNVEVELPGAQRPAEIVVVGAHYDTVPGSPGADDNASGVAVLLELARAWARRRPARTLRFVAFANEEAPFHGTELMGSGVYARRARHRGERIVAMLSLEMLGTYVERAGAQRYPRLLEPLLDDRADFVAFLANPASWRLLARAARAFRAAGVLSSSALAAPPALLPDLRRSDHAAFWAEGYPALMVTDTGPYRNPFYHTAADTMESLNYALMARAFAGLDASVAALAGA